MCSPTAYSAATRSAVVLDAAGLSATQMQAIASEFNYSETTFVQPPSDPAHSAWVRIFTPSREVPFAGHPNVGTAFVLAQERAAHGEAVPDQFVFEETAGLVPSPCCGRTGPWSARRCWRRNPCPAGRSLHPRMLLPACL